MKRIRVDRVGMELIARAWWAAEHRGTLEWPRDPLTQSLVIRQVKALIKRRRVHTPGDVAAIDLLDVQHAESARRARERSLRSARLKTMSTRQVLRLISLARGSGFVSLLYDEEVPGQLELRGALPLPLAELKAEATLREHVPNQKERAAIRQARAKAAKANRGRPSRR